MLERWLFACIGWQSRSNNRSLLAASLPRLVCAAAVADSDIVFTTGLPPSPPTGVSTCTAGLLCRRCWRLRPHRPASLSAADWCPRLYGWLVTPLFMGVHVVADWLAFAAADWCFHLHCWPIMLPLLGVYNFTAGLPSPPPTGVSA
ncbi:Os10g0197200 [Oryza sativa Japonica Group]|uniref:Os10g0197200 protein n=1 Tax=Oryza sativa subsp. japonica TaxID=39947 RepID=A0A0P0XST6_ORYSJ|nr:Os10g0197200 [Oryza sativa Japonica Group]